MRVNPQASELHLEVSHGIAVVSGSPSEMRRNLEAGLNTNAARILVLLDGANFGEEQLKQVGNQSSDVVFVTPRGVFSSVLNGVLKSIYDLKSSSSLLCSAVCFSRNAAKVGLASEGDGPRMLIECSRSGSSFSIGTSKTAERFAVSMLGRLLTVELLLSTLSKYVLVGLSGIVVNSLILFVQVDFFGLRPFLAVPLAFETSVFSNFLLNDYFTFRGGAGKALRLIKYNLSTVISFIAQLSTVYVLTESMKVHYLLASFFGIVLGFIMNYLLSLEIW